MNGPLISLLPGVFAVSAAIYLWLAVRASRATQESANNAIAYLLFLIGMLLLGSAFTFNTADAQLFGIGRTLTLFSSGFIPVVFYNTYRQFIVGRTHGFLLALLSIVPLLSTLLAVTNPLHHMIWTIAQVDGVVRFSEPGSHFWFARVHAPFAYALFAFSMIAMVGRLPTIALAHRRKLILLLVCATLPFLVSISNAVFAAGMAGFPFTSLSLVVLLPLFGWAGITLRVHEFSPLAYQTLFDHVRDPIIVLDRSQKIVSANRPAQRLLKHSEQELVGQGLWEDIPEAQSILDHSKDRDLTQTLRMQSDRYYELSSAPLTGPSGQNQGTVVVCRDVSERKQALQALADSEHLIRSLVEHSSAGILRFSRADSDDTSEFRCIFANRAAEQFLHQDNGSLIGSVLSEFTVLQPDNLVQHVERDEPAQSRTSYEVAVDYEGRETWLRIISEPIGVDFAVTMADITQRKRNESRILADAMRDPLTGILNRRGFEKEAADTLSKFDSGAVLYLDLNHFKSINDQFGHQAGDTLLKAFGRRLELCLRPEDILSRLGGDEFSIVLPGASVEDAKNVAHRLIEATFQAYIIQGREIECSASVGIALMPQHGKDLWHLVSVADQAMYKSKKISREDAANDKAAYVEASIAS